VSLSLTAAPPSASALGHLLASIPSPATGVWYLGPVPIRAYALSILAGVVVAVLVTERRLRARGGPTGVVTEIALWAVPIGIVGARIYHVLTSPGPYFGDGGDPVRALFIWQGGLGIWGGVAGGALGAWIACRRIGLPLGFFGDAAAPGIALAQAIGRLGNWFNQELFGRPTSLPWGLEIDPANRPARYLDVATFHPTFLYELLWNIGVAGFVWWADRRFQLGRGRAFALYVMAYTAGRVWIEALRIDEATPVLGLRINIWTSIVVFLGALVAFVLRRGPREQLATATGSTSADDDPVAQPGVLTPDDEPSTGGPIGGEAGKPHGRQDVEGGRSP